MTEPADLEWYTHDILANGRQACSIRRIPNRKPVVVLSSGLSALLQSTLHELPKQENVPFTEAKQAVLRAFFASARTDIALETA